MAVARRSKGQDKGTCRLWLLLNVMVGLGALIHVVGRGPAEAQPQEEVASGRELYVTGCSTCHGLDG